MNDAWKKYSADFDSMTDEEVERERESAQQLIDENEDWTEAVASWIAAGRPRTTGDRKVQCGDLDAGASNRYNHSKRGFTPK